MQKNGKDFPGKIAEFSREKPENALTDFFLFGKILS